MATLAYIGSKYSLLDAIDEVLLKNIPEAELQASVVLDLFSGTCAVGAHLNKKFGCAVVANDCEEYAAVMATAMLKCPFTEKLAQHIEAINSQPPESGPLAEELSEKRMFFTPENGKILQAARMYVERTEGLSGEEKAFLVASIMSSADRVANTTSVYASYLKHFKKSALRKLTVSPVHYNPQIPSVYRNNVHQQNANNFVHHTLVHEPGKQAIAFIDPPYVNRQYSSYYSPFNVIVSNNTADLRGVGAVMPSAYASDYSAKRKALAAFKQLVHGLTGKVDHIFLTYGAYGIMAEKDIVDALSEFGTVKRYSVGNKKYKSDTTQEDATVTEKWFFASKPVGGPQSA